MERSFNNPNLDDDPWRNDPVYDTDEEEEKFEDEDDDVTDDDEVDVVGGADDIECVCGCCSFGVDPDMAKKCCGVVNCLTKNPSGIK